MQKTLYTQQYQALLTQLRQARADAGITQRQLASRLEASQDEISKCETGVRRLDVVELKLWLDALGVPLLEFMDALNWNQAGVGAHAAPRDLKSQEV